MTVLSVIGISFDSINITESFLLWHLLAQILNCRLVLIGNLYLKFTLCSDCWEGKASYLFVMLAVSNFSVMCFLLEEKGGGQLG